jgi:hypothetical protein
MRRRTGGVQDILRETVISQGGYSYKYTLSVGQAPSSAYSLKIVMKSTDGISNQSSASVVISDGGRAVEFYNKLVRNLATPANLPYCVEDEFS